MTHHPPPAPGLSVPTQAPPIVRDPAGTGAAAADGAGAGGVEASATPCASLTGLARQMCYATRYGISV